MVKNINLVNVLPVLYCVLCLEKIRVIIPLNSKHYRPNVSLICNKHIGTHRLSESVSQWPCDSQQLAFPRAARTWKGRPAGPSPGGALVEVCVILNRKDRTRAGSRGESGGGWDIPKMSLCLLSSYSAEFSCPRRHKEPILYVVGLGDQKVKLVKMNNRMIKLIKMVDPPESRESRGIPACRSNTKVATGL